MTSFDWPALHGFAIRELRLRPSEFWALTPYEFATLVGPGGPAPMGKDGLTALMAQFPDTQEEPRDG